MNLYSGDEAWFWWIFTGLFIAFWPVVLCFEYYIHDHYKPWRKQWGEDDDNVPPMR